MIDQNVLARVHLYGLFKALELLPRIDEEAANLVRGRRLMIEFRTRGIGRAYLSLRDGRASFQARSYARQGDSGEGGFREEGFREERADVVLVFRSARHLNETIAGNQLPVVRRGFRYLRFLRRNLRAYAARLEYYLRPDAKRLVEPDYAAAVTRLASYVFFHALSEVGNHDRFASLSARYIPDGVIQIKVFEDVSIYVHARHGTLATGVGDHANPRCMLWFHDLQTLYELLGGTLNTYDGMMLGRLVMKGFLPMIEFLTPVLGRVPAYLR